GTIGRAGASHASLTSGDWVSTALWWSTPQERHNHEHSTIDVRRGVGCGCTVTLEHLWADSSLVKNNGLVRGVPDCIPFHFAPRHANEIEAVYANVQVAYEADGERLSAGSSVTLTSQSCNLHSPEI